MEEIRIVIVDDSSFSVAFIKDILENEGLNVVGEAGTLEEVKKVVKEKKPTLVTMDMTLPGTDGFECTRAIHEIDASIKVIVVSSMMDDEIIRDAKRNKVSAYIQKPVDALELIMAVKRVTASDELYKFLQYEYFSFFKEALKDGMSKMTKTNITYQDEYTNSKEHESKGMSVIIGIIGKFSGRMLLDFSLETANKLAFSMLKREAKSTEEVMEVLAEFTNIISGNACSLLNRKNSALGLRVAPPSILRGDSVLISAPNFSTKTAIVETEFGGMLLDVGFKRGEEKWT